MSLPPAEAPYLADVFPGDSAVSRLMRAHDWAATPLGSPEHWPEGLKIPLRMMLTSRFEMWLGWGTDVAFFYNDAYVPTLGSKHPASLGRPVSEVWKEIYADVEGRIRSVMDDGMSTWDEALQLLVERNGYPEETYHTFSYSPLRGDSGKVEGLMCVVSEETERVISERRLDVLREVAHSLLDTTTREQMLAALQRKLSQARRDFPFALIYLQDAEGGMSGCAMTLDAEVLLQRRWDFEVFADGRNASIVDLEGPGADSLPTGDWRIPPRRALIVPLARTGAAKPFGMLVLGLNPYLPEDPTIAGMAQLLAGQIGGALANIEALTLASSRAQRLWSKSSDLSVIIDAAGIFRAVSPSWTRILGHPTEAVVGHSFLEFLHPDEVLSAQKAVHDPSLASDLRSFENRYVDTAGETRWISWNTVTEDDQVYAYGRDITQAKQQADALKLAEESLRQSQKMEAIGQLTGGVAHDFNNLLTVIRSASDLLKRPDLSEDRRRRYVDAISETADRAAKLTGQLLAFARRQSLMPEVFDVADRVAMLGEMIGSLTGSRIRYRNELSELPGFIKADAGQFDTAVVNMIVNARDAIAGGEGSIVVSVSPVSGIPAIRTHPAVEGDFIAISIRDTGAGIASQNLERVFEPFFTTKPVGHGTGLGLSQVFGFAKQSGGDVKLESEVGQGTTFTLYLPAVQVEVPTSGAGIAADAVHDEGHGARVLVVEDNVDVGELAAMSLDELGYVTVLAMNGEEALACLDREPEGFDVVFSDVVMPGISGIELAKRIRQRRPQLPVLLTSGYSNILVENGSDGFELLQKPYSVDQLSQMLRKVMGSKAAIGYGAHRVTH